MALVAVAVVEFHSGGDDAARAAAQRALDFATTSGLAVPRNRARPLPSWRRPAPGATASAERRARGPRRRPAGQRRHWARSSLTLAGEVLLREGTARGSALLDEAAELLELSRPRHCAAAVTTGDEAPSPDSFTGPSRVGLVEQLSERELAVLRYLPSTLSLPEIARAVRLAEHGEDAVQRRPTASSRARSPVVRLQCRPPVSITCSEAVAPGCPRTEMLRRAGRGGARCRMTNDERRANDESRQRARLGGTTTRRRRSTSRSPSGGTQATLAHCDLARLGLLGHRDADGEHTVVQVAALQVFQVEPVAQLDLATERAAIALAEVRRSVS